MKTTIAAVVIVSSLFASNAYALNGEERDVLESSLERSIQHDVTHARSQVKYENQMELMQLVAEFKFALSPSRMVANVAETAANLLVGNEE